MSRVIKLEKAQGGSKKLTSSHNSRFDGSRAPIRMNRLEKSGDTGDVRAGHGSARDNIKRNATPVVGGE